MKATDMITVDTESKIMLEHMEQVGLNSLDYLPRVNCPLEVNKGWLSIQCSATHHCTPRTSKHNIHEYETYELGILDMKGSLIADEERIVRLLAGFSKLDELMSCYSTPIFDYVPRDLVNELYDFMKEKCFK